MLLIVSSTFHGRLSSSLLGRLLSVGTLWSLLGLLCTRLSALHGSLLLCSMLTHHMVIPSRVVGWVLLLNVSSLLFDG